MSTGNSESRLERIGGTVVLILLAGYALYSGGRALITGEFVAFGVRGSPYRHYTGIHAYLSGTFIVAIGATLLVSLRLGMRGSNIIAALFVVDLVLFAVTLGAILFA
jgi:hypothetical protein